MFCTMMCSVSQSCPTLCDPMDYNMPGSSVHGDSPGKNRGVGCHASSVGSILVSKEQDGESSGKIRFLVDKTEPKSCPGRQVGWTSSILQDESQSVPNAEIL